MALLTLSDLLHVKEAIKEGKEWVSMALTLGSSGNSGQWLWGVVGAMNIFRSTTQRRSMGCGP